MITSAALAALYYSAAVTALALVARLSIRRRPAIRAAATRVLVVFAVVGIAAAYVCIELGPEVDAALAGPARVPLPSATRTFDV